MSFGVILPYLSFFAAIIGVVGMIVFAPPAAKEALNAGYTDLLKTIALVAGPAAAAWVGDLATGAERPQFPPDASPNLRRWYTIGRVASCLVFGFLAGTGGDWIGVPPPARYGLAALGGLVGIKVLNLYVNRAIERGLDKFLPPGAGKGGAP